MKKIVIAGFILIACNSGVFSKNISITNPNGMDIKDAPVVVQLDKVKIPVNKRATLSVIMDGKQISSQIDDLNQDGIADELVFLADLKAGETRRVSLKNLSEKKKNQFPAEVYTSLIVKDGDQKKYVSEISSDKNDMYNKLHHHGVAFESALMAYRIYFDNKSTVDLYGKKTYRLELADTEWYPTDDQLAAGYGDDILLVSGWVGAGTVKGWDGKKALHIDQFQQRSQRIVSKGNLRIVAETAVKGWKYEGKTVDMKVRYIQYARHRDVMAEISCSEDLNNIVTGVQQIADGACFKSNQLAGSWGSWYPQPDTVKYKKETVGLGVYMPEKFQGKQTMDGVNNLIIAPYKKGDVLRFYITAIAAKEENQSVQTAEAFFKYLNMWRQGLEMIEVK